MGDTKDIVRIVIADDHAIFRDGLHRLLEAEPGFSVVGEAADGREAVKRVAELKPDILLLDLAMPKAGGIEALQELLERRLEVKSVLLTAAIDRAETVKALQLGVRGVVLKDAATQLLYRCLRAVMIGEYWVGHERVLDIVERLREVGRSAAEPTPVTMLTRRELQIVAAIAEGASNKEIGQQFNLSEQTIKNHLSHIFDKVGVSNRLELALYAMHHRLLEGFDAGNGGKR
jgi:DNA-binding NarL/FixJ family response regulator